MNLNLHYESIAVECSAENLLHLPFLGLANLMDSRPEEEIDGVD